MATNLSFRVQPCSRSNPSAPHSMFVQTVIAARPLRTDAGKWWPGAAFRGLCSFVREQVAVGPSRTPTYLTRLHCLQLDTKHTRARSVTATSPCFPPRADRSSSQASDTKPEPLAKPTPASSCPQLVRESPNCVSRLGPVVSGLRGVCLWHAPLPRSPRHPEMSRPSCDMASKLVPFTIRLHH